jgi:TonB-linked SusC/RagA family outer membrane protein
MVFKYLSTSKQTKGMKLIASGWHLCAPTKMIVLRKWPFFMKLSCLFIFASLCGANLLIAAPATSQRLETTKVSINLNGESLKRGLEQIEMQTDFRFAYVESQIARYKILYLSGKSQSLLLTLQALFSGTELRYGVKNNTIIIVEKSNAKVNEKEETGDAEEVAIKPDINLYKIAIRGRITDDKDQPLSNVSITEKGTSNGTVTKEDGSFSVSVTSTSSVLVISSIGFVEQEVSVGNRSVINLQLSPVTSSLNDVVVIGYGTQKKTSITGAVSSISSKEIVTTKNGDITNMLAGKLPGLRIAQRNGEPGSYAAQFDIRGLGNPLVVVDGVPRNNFNRIDPNEVESISILKDASAAVYGVRAANGVVLITTKKGKAGKIDLVYSGNLGIMQIANSPHVMNAFQFATLTDEADFNSGATTPTYSKDDLAKFKDGTYPSTNWQNLVTRKSSYSQQHNLSASGGTDKIKYFISLGYYNEQGIWKSGDLNYKRYNFRSNITAQIAKNLDAELFLGGYTDTKNEPGQTSWVVFKSIWMQKPTIPVYANNNPAYFSNVADGTHPLVVTNKSLSGYNINTTKNLQGTFALNYKLPYIDGLKARFMFGYDPSYGFRKQWQKQYALYDYNTATTQYVPSLVNAPSNLGQYFSDLTMTTLQGSLNYEKTFAAAHNVKALVLFEKRQQSGNAFQGYRQFSVDAVDQLYAGNALNQTTNSSNVDNVVTEGVVGRLNYDYQGKYFIEGSFRKDGSSKFGPDHRWGFFPAGSAGWRISEENFFKEHASLSFVNNLKIRASYGVLGDDGSSTYQFVSGYNYPGPNGPNGGYPAGYVFGPGLVNGLGFRGMPNLLISWYTSKTADLGIDADLWNGKLHVEADIFERTRSGLLATRNLSLPATVGAGLPQENLNGDMTRGLELLLSTRNKIGQLVYNVSGNVSFARSKNLYVERAASSNSYKNFRDNNSYRWNDIYWGYTTIGQFQSMDDIKSSPVQDAQGNRTLLPGDLKYKDFNKDGIIDDNDVTPIGRNNSIPQINFGLTLGAQMKGFDLNVLLQGASKFWVNYLGSDQLAKPLPWGRNGLDVFTDRWHKADPFDPKSEWVAGKFPTTRPNGSFGGNYVNSTYWLYDASYLRLKSIELGYTLNVSRVIKSLRIYANGFNLFTWSKMNSFIDPEHANSTYGYEYPIMRTFNLGVNLTF